MACFVRTTVFEKLRDKFRKVPKVKKSRQSKNNTESQKIKCFNFQNFCLIFKQKEPVFLFESRQCSTPKIFCQLIVQKFLTI